MGDFCFWVHNPDKKIMFTLVIVSHFSKHKPIYWFRSIERTIFQLHSFTAPKLALFMRFISKFFSGGAGGSGVRQTFALALSLPLLHSSERRTEIHLGITRTMGQKADGPLETEIGCTLKFSSSQGPIYPPLVQFKWRSSWPKAFLPLCVLYCVRAGACIFQDPGALP
jgi:hypothetical protein